MTNDSYQRLVQAALPPLVSSKEFLNHYPSPIELKQITRGGRQKLVNEWGPAMACFLSALDLGALITRATPTVIGTAYSSMALGQMMVNHFAGVEYEEVCVAYTDVHNQIIALETLFKGGRSECVLYPDRIFKGALQNSASGLVLIHNHPSGAIEPSAQDLAFARRLERGSRILGLSLLDFMVVGRTNYYSWREEKEQK